MGSVYVFNVSVLIVRLSVNAMLSQPIQPVPAAPYTPFEIQIERTTPPASTVAFFDGQDNPVAVQLKDGNQSQTAWLSVPGPSESTDDLWLYVSYELLLLLSTEGKIAAHAEVVWAS